ncbi:hypothetical protein FOL46_000115 [Perkinsus olseni]|uniref:Macro domain-containing protein n=1 Tax=Perkinsus olseni TaxID=32597 RepID=A0A7J6MWQ2_PEROL|nr:hypothetical protein FOL46_000115 [Perkinsus olseni]
MSLPRRVCVDEIVLSIPTKDFLILGYLTELVDGLQPRIPDELRRDVGECLRLSFALPTMRTLVKGCSVETYWGLVQVAGGFAVVNCSPLGFDFLRWDSSGALLCRKTFSFPPGVLAHVGEPFFTSDTSGSSIYVVSYSSLSEQLSVSILPLEGKEKYYYVSWPDARKAEPYIAGVKELCSRLYILAFESNGDRLLWLDLDRLSYGKLNEFKMLCRIAVNGSAPPWCVQRRCLSWLGKQKSKARNLALHQHNQWMTELQAANEADKQIWMVDKQLRSTPRQRIETKFRYASPHKQKSQQRGEVKTEEWAEEDDENFSNLEELIKPTYRGAICNVPVEPFGSITAHHGSIFEWQGDCLILPMSPNIMPYRGLPLEALERGGRDLIKDVFGFVRSDQSLREQIEPPDLGPTVKANFNSGLPVGTVIPAPAHGINNVAAVFFVVMPYFWQGSSTDAERRFRYAVRSALEYVSSHAEIRSVAMPHLGRGIFGFADHKGSMGPTMIMAEEAFDAILCRDRTSDANYTLQNVTLIDIDNDVVEMMRDSLLMVAERTFPDKQVEPAAVHQGKLVRRLMMMHDMHELNLTRKRDKYKFKKYSGVIRNRADHWRANIMPWVWRSQKVNIPPPLMVRKKTGTPPDTGEDTSPEADHITTPTLVTGFSQLIRNRASRESEGQRAEVALAVYKPLFRFNMARLTTTERLWDMSLYIALLGRLYKDRGVEGSFQYLAADVVRYAWPWRRALISNLERPAYAGSHRPSHTVACSASTTLGRALASAAF